MNNLPKVILDTDIGDDIDDAFALACLLNMQDKVNIVGITTVFVNSESVKYAMNEDVYVLIP